MAVRGSVICAKGRLMCSDRMKKLLCQKLEMCLFTAVCGYLTTDPTECPESTGKRTHNRHIDVRTGLSDRTICSGLCVSLIQMAAGLFIGRKSEPADTIHRSVDYCAVESFASIYKGHKTQTWGHSNPNCIPDLLTLSPFADPDDTQTGRAGSSKAANQLYPGCCWCLS